MTMRPALTENDAESLECQEGARRAAVALRSHVRLHGPDLRRIQIAAAHEFGHQLGFEDAYDTATLAPLHSQTSDIMTAAGPGKQVLGAHGRLLVEKYGK